ncbi:MAG TPA: tetratricopeptide repeat protein [Candidatus Aminicenantes bacterium]|nr:tetratricopeptide repeat protein [Candidatus Aminicenantes bacterium]
MDRRLIVLCLVPLLLGWHWFDAAARRNAAGMEAYSQGRFGEALQKFLSARGLKPENTALQHNTAAAMYKLGKFQEALEEFSRVDPGRCGVSKRDFHYNLGNTYFRLKQFDKALDHYKQALLQDPEDLDAKRNFELALQRLERQKKQQQDPKQSHRDQKKNRGESEPKPQPPKSEGRQEQKPQEKYQTLLQYLSQKEKEQLKERKRKVAREARREKDW